MPLTAVGPGLWTYVHRHRFPGHGAVVEAPDARARTRAALAWVLA